MKHALFASTLLALLACSSEDYRSSSPSTTSTGAAGTTGAAGSGGAGQSAKAGNSGTAGASGAAGGAGAAGAAGMAGSAPGGAAGSAGAGGGGGSAGSAAPCNEHPWDCESGTTCWPANVNGKVFDCRKSEPGVATGSCCKNIIGFATCGDGDACVGMTTTTSTCKRYCKVGDTAHGCPTGQTCTERTLVPGGSVFAVCEPATPASCPP